MPEEYTPGYSANAASFMAARSIDHHGAFFKPYLHRGMHLLDCGCGPGTITVGFAQAIAPGTVVGIDRELSQINLARTYAAEQAVENVDFQTANAYDLPFANNTFDAAFSHALFEHLQEPIRALQELFRVLKPGGAIGLRSPDWGGFLVAPTNPKLEEAMDFYQQLQQQNGGNPYIGRTLRALLRQAGFTQIKASASYECYEPISRATKYLALRIEVSDAPSKHTMSRALRELSEHPDALFAQSWCEAVAFKEEAIRG